MTYPNLNTEEIEIMRPRLIEAAKNTGYRTTDDEINRLCNMALAAIKPEKEET